MSHHHQVPGKVYVLERPVAVDEATADARDVGIVTYSGLVDDGRFGLRYVPGDC